MYAERSSPTRFRLAWRWKKSGLTGVGPWVRDSDVVEAWLDALSRRDGDRILHWIESEEEAGRRAAIGQAAPQPAV
jgi:hypothetical protein